MREYCNLVKHNKSFFVIATNDIERDWKPEQLLKQYKSQSRVERGFRFLKDPEFFADSIFLSKNERIQSLFTVMTLSLAVFSGLEWKFQHAMKTTRTKLKNQVGKLVDKITLRFVFQEFEEFLVLVGQDGYRIFDVLLEQQSKILELLGKNYLKAYGV